MGPRLWASVWALGLAVAAAQHIGGPNATEGAGQRDVVCNEGKWHSCVCGQQGGEWRGLLPHCYALLNSSRRARVLRVAFRPRRQPAPCLGTTAEWGSRAWALRSLVAERLNVFCLASRQRGRDECVGARLNLRTISVLLLRVDCEAVELAVLKRLDSRLLSPEASFSPATLIRVLEPWSSVLRLLLKRDGAVFSVREIAFPSAVPRLAQAAVSDRLFLLLYLFSAALLIALLLCFVYHRNYPTLPS